MSAGDHIAHAHSSHCHIVLPSWLAWSCLVAFCLLFVYLASIRRIMTGLFWFFEVSRIHRPQPFSLSAFNPSHHLSVRDIAVDVPLNPCCLQICIKASKTDPFQKGRNILIWPGSPPLCAVQPVASFLECRGNLPGPLFLFKNGLPSSSSLLTDRLRAILLNAGLA